MSGSKSHYLNQSPFHIISNLFPNGFCFSGKKVIPKASEQKFDCDALNKARVERLAKLKAKRGEFDAEAAKEGHDARGAPPPDTETTPQSKKGDKQVSPKKIKPPPAKEKDLAKS